MITLEVRLKEYCDKIHDAGHKFMLSNSDCKGMNGDDNFFDNLYSSYKIERLVASRSINSNPHKRGKLTEILVHNYLNTKANTTKSKLHRKLKTGKRCKTKYAYRLT